MIKTKTLFILGAGASKPFGYPTGIELRDNILKCDFNKDMLTALKKSPNIVDFRSNEIQVKKFKEQFTKSGVYSIDTFLEHLSPSLEHREIFMNIGKIYIAKVLISCEKDNNLRQTKDNWYMYLFDHLKTSFEELSQNNISFITFNYDRSLEYFLYEAIQNLFHKGTKECEEMMESFPIVHLYGQLDPLPWQAKGGKRYLHSDLIERLSAAPENIKLISDERDTKESEEFQKAYKLIDGAERMFFLGFSFDKTNLERLQAVRMQNKSIFATVHGLKGAKANWVDQYFSKRSCTSKLLANKDALSLLQDHLTIE